MLGWLRLKGKQAAAGLPAELSAAIEGAAFYERGEGENGPRIVVQLAGRNAGWIWGEDDAKHLRRTFPELDNDQLSRALKFIAARIAARPSGETSRRRSWAKDW